MTNHEMTIGTLKNLNKDIVNALHLAEELPMAEGNGAEIERSLLRALRLVESELAYYEGGD